MSTQFQVRAMVAVLSQGRLVGLISALLAAAALLMLCVARPGLVAAVAAITSLLLAAAQAWHAARVAFDRDLLLALLDSHPEAPPGLIDDVLQKLGLRKAPETTRGWQPRWLGMRRLLRLQALCLGVQALLMLVALLCLPVT